MPAKKKRYNKITLMLSFYSLQPGFGHQLGAGQGWMYAIRGPIGTWSGLLGLVADLLVRDESCAEAVGDLAGRLAIFVESGIPFIVDGLDADHGIGFADDELYVGERLFGPVEEGFVVITIGLDRACVSVDKGMPEIIDADEDAEHGGFEIETIRLPAFGKLIDFVAADAPVVTLEGFSRIAIEHFGRREKRIAGAESGGAVGVDVASLPVHIRDAVALEEDDVIVGKRDLLRLCRLVSSGHDLRDVDGCQGGQSRGLQKKIGRASCRERV